MKFIVKREALDLGLKVVGIIIKNINNSQMNKDILIFKEKAYKELKEKYKNFNIETDLILRGFNEIHKKIDIKRRKNIPINEYIIKRFLKSEPLEEGNCLIELYNIITLDSRLFIAIHDLDKIKGDVTLEITNNKKYATVKNEIKTINQDEYVYMDAQDVIYRLDVDQSQKTLFTDNTKNIFITLEGNEATSAEYLMEVASEIIDLITTYCGGTAQIIYK